jgi:hypothetical protein
MSAQIDEVSSAFPWRGRFVVIGNTELLCFDPPTREEFSAHTNWDGGTQSCSGGAQEEVSETK